MPGKCSHSCPLAAFLPSLLLALLFMAASSSYPTRSSDRARNAATQISTAFRTSPLDNLEEFIPQREWATIFVFADLGTKAEFLA
jgi:hypothetical protein